MKCVSCGSEHVKSQLFQEDLGESTTSKTKTKTAGHGVVYWIFLGWWIWLPKLLLWIVAFIPMAILKALRKKKTKSSTVSSTIKNVQYKTVYTCEDCGHTWSAVTK